MSDKIEMPLHTATWRGVLPIYMQQIRTNANGIADNIARHEIRRMADAADMFGKFTHALQEVEGVLRNKVNSSQTRDSKALKIIKEVLDEAREVAKEDQQ
tara:strand:- start:251 stop:550 length:300 start_codon:yes stop_codon:yes gene_type:complete